VRTAAVAGLLVVVAHMWAPLVVVAAPAGLVLLLSLRRGSGRPEDRTNLWGTLALAAAAAVGVGRAVLGLFADVDVATVVSAFGGIHGTHPLPVLVLTVVGAYACAVAPSVVRRQQASDAPDALDARRVRLLGLAPVIGLLFSSALLAAQLRSVGTSAYYFLKFFMGYELILAGLVPAVVGFLVAGAPAVVRAGRGVTAAVSLAAVALATQAFGPFPRGEAPLHDADRGGTASVGRPFDARRIAQGVVTAARSSEPSEALRRDYLALGDERAAEAFYPDGWYHGVTASLSGDVQARVDVLRTRVDTAQEAAPVVRRLLREHPGTTVVVAHEHLAELRQLLGADALAERVVAW
jgi:hypothetical protein